MPDHEWVVDDLVKGEVRFAPGQLRDFVLVRSDGSPVFLLAVAVDDMAMGVTHVVRGDDLLASAPRNAAVIEALGGTPPRYAHVPQVLGPDRQPLSKRHGSTSVQAFREQGYLPEAIVNYLALLGWSAGDDREFLSREELIDAFDLERVSSNPAAFDTEKLTWMNQHYLQRLDDDDLAARCLHFLAEAGLMPEPAALRSAMPLVKERMKTLAESADLLRFLFSDDIELNEKAQGLIAKAPEGYLASRGRGAGTGRALGRRDDRCRDGWPRRGSRAQPDEGLAADPRGGHRFQRLARRSPSRSRSSAGIGPSRALGRGRMTSRRVATPALLAVFLAVSASPPPLMQVCTRGRARQPRSALADRGRLRAASTPRSSARPSCGIPSGIRRVAARRWPRTPAGTTAPRRGTSRARTSSSSTTRPAHRSRASSTTTRRTARTWGRCPVSARTS